MGKTIDQKFMKFTRARNQAKWECKKARKAFEKDVAKQSKKNPKAFWQYVNSKLKYKDNVADLHTIGGIAMTDQQKADALSEFYKRIFTQEDTKSIPHFELRQVDATLEDITFTWQDVEDLLKELGVKKITRARPTPPTVIIQGSEGNFQTTIPNI